jgi:hypothetical protein
MKRTLAALCDGRTLATLLYIIPHARHRYIRKKQLQSAADESMLPHLYVSISCSSTSAIATFPGSFVEAPLQLPSHLVKKSSIFHT